jgi:hypothetical protein
VPVWEQAEHLLGMEVLVASQSSITTHVFEIKLEPFNLYPDLQAMQPDSVLSTAVAAPM